MIGPGGAALWHPARRALRRGLRSAALRLAGALMLIGGLVALAAAGWIALAAVHGHAVAALVTGGLVAAAGLALLLWPSAAPAATGAPPQAPAEPRAPGRDPLLVDGFLIGLAAAAALRGRPR